MKNKNYHNGGQYKPNLIIPNVLAAERLRDYLDKFCKKKRKDYCNRCKK